MRFAGALLVGIAAVLAGLYAGKTVRRRVELLSQCVCLAQFFSVGIGYGDEPVELLAQKAAQSAEMKGLVFLTDDGLKGGGDFSQRWADCVDRAACRMALNVYDRELLKSFGGKLGTTDVQRQLELCEMYKQRFTDSLDSAKSRQNERMRLFSIGGVTLGALVFVLLI